MPTLLGTPNRGNHGEIAPTQIQLSILTIDEPAAYSTEQYPAHPPQDAPNSQGFNYPGLPSNWGGAKQLGWCQAWVVTNATHPP
ncbi:hypothetical protein PROH_05145 [Prochlorothrix hollandica PCC 9006 = CALU 1027]|uniref:Uncharacterized protein n=1 Tax=Prochlorothrix hollandica PCC 9006 = CALU 1027 TaxID=317619 RepID=A0A0M2Q036_PROHO|nr:hypothetical protein PROH_05145 [Prochlorothrix hollandica PCC 9006 = CALU 1027]